MDGTWWVSTCVRGGTCGLFFLPLFSSRLSLLKNRLNLSKSLPNSSEILKNPGEHHDSCTLFPHVSMAHTPNIQPIWAHPPPFRSQAGPRAVGGASRHQQRQRGGVSAAAGCQPAGDQGSMGLGWAGVMEDFHGPQWGY